MAVIAIGAAVLASCKSEPALVAGSSDSYEFAARARRAIPGGTDDSSAERMLVAQGFACAHTDTLQSDEGDTLQSRSAPDDPGTEYLTCDYVRSRRWGEHTQRRYVVVLYIREHRVDRVFAVTHLQEVH
ncbi:MAG: hypothetical protein JJD97_10210 [Gemmatimonadaceae bacterium]|nr:hypothetical protein [Gemmatimonadaceae bacterium]